MFWAYVTDTLKAVKGFKVGQAFNDGQTYLLGVLTENHGSYQWLKRLNCEVSIMFHFTVYMNECNN